MRALVMLLLAVPAFGVKVQVEGGAVVELPLERYVAGVLAGESSMFRSDAALRAMAVAARTYAVRMRGRRKATISAAARTANAWTWTASHRIWNRLPRRPRARCCGSRASRP